MRPWFTKPMQKNNALVGTMDSIFSPIVLASLLAGGALPGLAAASDSAGLPLAATKHWTADNGNGTYSNPLFYEEFEDPDIIRVGED